ncbi:MAG: histidine phosphatase family protein [Thermoflexales bacterium]|nr:histidine phosphatase family protein [Thermoflexales bacterium]MCS7324799.1 histidine phosphatase family protein [Thermoflexales bacterium]MDW8053123.1 histidine phosphatase family protein [Anaerolineae bacterium]MDW8291776.1 histidine phosphatase family protein [Anaerolineae bacterium]
MLILYLIRHGRTHYNAEGRVQGWRDIPLDTVGRQQAHLLAARLATLPLDAVYASPLARAWETASIIARACLLEPHADERLREYNMGDWTDLTSEEIRTRWPDAEQLDAPPNGETALEVAQRVSAFLDDLLVRHPDGAQVAIVSHGGTLSAMIGVMVGLPPRRRQPFTFGNASISEVRFEHGRWRVHTLNEQHHLLAAIAHPAGESAGDAAAAA